MTRIPLVLEMETQDPDDFIALAWIADHPEVELLAVMLTPGTEDQCQLVRWALDMLKRPKVLIGSFVGTHSPRFANRAVSGWHYAAFPAFKQHDLGLVDYGPEMLRSLLAHEDGGVTYLCGSAPKNLGAAFYKGGVFLDRWVQQGFFAGDNLVAPEHRLAKFQGRLTCPSFNPGGAPVDAQRLLINPHIARRVLVSKNVCHGVTWDYDRQHDFAALRKDLNATTRAGIVLFNLALGAYLTKHPTGKAMHDVLASAVAIDERICTFREVAVTYHKGAWGAQAASGTRTWISVNYAPDAFLRTLAGRGDPA